MSDAQINEASGWANYPPAHINPEVCRARRQLRASLVHCGHGSYPGTEFCENEKKRIKGPEYVPDGGKPYEGIKH